MKGIIKYNITKQKNAIYLTPSSNKYSKVLFFMHGLGDCADSFIDIFEQVQVTTEDFKIVLLNAEKNPVTLNGGMVMPSWYDISTLDSKDSKSSVNEKDVQASTERVMKYVEEEVTSVNNDYKNIYFGGFSQGGCMSLYIGLTVNKKFGGIICLSGLLFPFIKLQKDKLDIPIFIGHGLYDGVIPLKLAEMSYKMLLSENATKISYNQYKIDHSINMEELQDLKKFIEKL